MERGSCRVLGEFEIFLFFSFLLLGGLLGEREREGERGSGIEGES